MQWIVSHEATVHCHFNKTIDRTMNFQYLKRFVLLLAVLGAFSALNSCGDDTTVDDSGFDRKALLEDVGTNLIIPNFEALQSSVQALSSTTATFTTNPTEANLQSVRQSWVQAVTDFQHCSAFGFGPGNLPLGSFATVLGVFPVDEDQVEQNILDPNFNLTATFDRDVRGFFAVEYLIYGNGQTDAEIISSFSQDRKDYLLLIVGELESVFNTIASEWNGTYLQEFINNDGTSAGSSISLLYNEFLKDYENIKNFKIELPSGLTAGQEEIRPELVEAYYSGISRSLIVENFESSKNIWYGRTKAGQNFSGFKEYVESVVEGPVLVNTTIEAIGRIDAAIAALPQGKFSDHVGGEEAVALRNELQSNTANFKSSMSSLLGISITFNSGDGD